MCGSKMLDRSVAPDSARIAVVYQFSCGATTFYSYVVGVGKTERDALAFEGTVLTVNDPSPPVLDPSGGNPRVYFMKWGSDIRVHWTGKRTLNVDYDGRADISRKERKVRGVKISFTTH